MKDKLSVRLQLLLDAIPAATIVGGEKLRRGVMTALEQAYRMGKRDERKARTRVGHEEMVGWWMDHLHDGKGSCLLCKDKGWFNLSIPGGVRSVWCICPVGQQAEKKESKR